ncbi:unannotated protein [freshwater metagenome]|uniref:Unannotated protein n=1 Tax=freshwater metagenome TaxID=449393 RepID=A0A6J6TT57_9ZZZZ
MRIEGFFIKISSAALSYSGAMITSVKTSETCVAIATVTVRFAAITPPKAETGSQACALVYASEISLPIATPHGLACLMMATHG